jgi:hypothetical protein
VISDKPVPSRAWASLPATYLTIAKLNKPPGISNLDSTVKLHSKNIPLGHGIFARKNIPKKTQFGPLEGAALKEGSPDLNQGLEFSVELEGGGFMYFDTSNERKIFHK